MNRNLLSAIFLLFFTAGCSKTKEQSTDHLHVLGFKDVTCTRATRSTATCIADKVQFHCVTADAEAPEIIDHMLAEKRFVMPLRKLGEPNG
jgi:hypothetical protein